jgi:pyruvate kinase
MLREVKFFMEGFEITKEYAMELLKKYADESCIEYEDAVNEISVDGDVLLKDGYLSMVTEMDGCAEEYISAIFGV